MNRNVYRLVFNRKTGLLTAVSEMARAGRSHAAAGAGAALLLSTLAQAAGPLPNVSANALPDHANAAIQAGNVSFSTGTRSYNNVDYSSLNVNVASDKAIIRWNNGFDIGSRAWVDFNHAGGAAGQTLNQIGGASPSQIMGRMTSNGQVLLINQNGILFGNGAQVDVHSLTASSLNLSDELFLNGLLSLDVMNGPRAAFDGTGGFVKVLGDAGITTAKGGRVMLLAPTVVNAGSISAPEGQVIMAAGSKVYLAASGDANLRGLLVEVDNPAISGGSEENTAIPVDVRHDGHDTLGTATNLGSLTSERGNVTMVGLAVNQSGLARATTSVQLNGSIYLKAQDTAKDLDPSTKVFKLSAQRAGALVLGQDSRTEIMPDRNDPANTGAPVEPTSLDSQTFNPSTVNLSGKTIRMEQAAGIVVPGGTVTFSAVADPSANNGNPHGQFAPAVDGVRVEFAAGSYVDVAGLTDVDVSVARNIVEAELRGDQLKDSPLQRDGFLHASKVYVDVNAGTPLADVSGYTSQIGRTAAERSTAGGNIVVQSQGDILFRDGASFDVSGGQVNYTPAWVRTTQLSSEGKVYDIAVADPDRVYDGIVGQYTVYNPKFNVNKTVVIAPTYRYDAGYVEGKDAGSVTFSAPHAVLAGTLAANTVAGQYQREPARLPEGGQLVVGAMLNEQGVFKYRTLSEIIVGMSPESSAGLAGTEALPATFKDTLKIDADAFRQGFNRVVIYSDKAIRVAEDHPVVLNPGGSITLAGNSAISIGADVRVAGGSIEIASTNTSGQEVAIGDGVALSASGLWTNDLPSQVPFDGRSSVSLNGGSVKLSTLGDLTLGEDSLVDVSGGGWLQSSGRLKSGNAGSIELSDGKYGDKTTLGGELRGYALGKGGSLSIKTTAVQIRDNPAGASDPADRLVLTPGFFAQGGFSAYSIDGAQGLEVASGAQISLEPGSLALQLPSFDGGRFQAGYQQQPSGAELATFARPESLPAHLRKPSSLTLSASNAEYGVLTIAQDSRLDAGVGGSLDVKAGRQMTVDGALSARGGRIALTMTGNVDSLPLYGDQILWVGANSRIDASGVAKTYADRRGLVQGDVLSGGQVTLAANKGYIVAESGAVIDVSGAEPVHLDIANTQGGVGQSVASDAGGVTVSAPEGIFLDAQLRGHAGDEHARGGSLTVTLQRAAQPSSANPDPASYPDSPRILMVRDSGQSLPAGLRPGDAIHASDNGKAHVNAGDVTRQGFENLSLSSRPHQEGNVPSGQTARIEFQGPLDLGAGKPLRILSLDAPVIASGDGESVRLSADYASLGNTSRNQAGYTAEGTAGALHVQAEMIDLVGRMTLNNFGEVRFDSEGDVRFLANNNIEVPLAERFSGGLSAAGNLTFQAAQLYPTTLTRFDVKTDLATGRISIAGNGVSARAPLSAGGSLAFSAGDIDQGGTVRAPFGQLDFAATRALNLEPGSVTSVAARDVDGSPMLIPFGSTKNEREWVYQAASELAVDALPVKRVSLKGESVQVKDNALLDLSGGGEMLGYEFFVGPGGSRDILADEGVYAIFPDYSSRFAPSDIQYNENFDLLPGERVYLSGGNGLTAGLYTLMPAHYALLPGAYAVRKVAGSKDFMPAQGYTQPDGIQVMAGYSTDSRYQEGTTNGPRDARWSAFEVLSRAQVQERSEYALHGASDFFMAQGAQTPLPRDVGSLGFDVTGAVLGLDGVIRLTPDAHGRGAAVDVAASRIAVAGDGVAGIDADTLRLDPDKLNALQAESLFLGGLRGGGNVLDVKSGQVLVHGVPAGEMAQGGHLSAPEIILAATGTIDVQAGSLLMGTGGTNGAGRDYITSGNGALLLLSGFDASFSRTGSPDHATGLLNIAAGARLMASETAVLDGTRDTVNHGALLFADAGGNPVAGGSLTLGSSRISVGDVTAAMEGLLLGSSELDGFSSLDRLALNSYSSIDLYGGVKLGGAGFKHLNLNAGGLKGYDNAGLTATLQAETIALTNTASVDAGDAASGDGRLALTADTLVLGQGGKRLSGFGTVQATAAEIVGEGSGGLDAGAASVVLTTGRITGAAGASQKLTSTGMIATETQALGMALAPVTALGAEWTFEGGSISHGASLDLPAGNVTMTATDGNLVIGPTGSIRTAGATVRFADTSVAAPGGRVALVSSSGNVEIQADADDPSQHGIVDVSAATGGESGRLSIVATNGIARIAGNAIQAHADDAGDSGDFALDVRTVDDFSSLAARLQEGGFNRAQELRVRDGDVIIAADDRLKAREFMLSADNGHITVAGQVDADGRRGGRIALYAGRGLTLTSGGYLQARADGEGARGGQVELSAGTGTLDMTGGRINVSAGPGGDAGEVLLRALRTGAGAGTGVNVGAPLQTEILGAGRVVLEAVKGYDNLSSLSTSSFATFNTDSNSFMGHANTIRTTLGVTDMAGFHLRPGVEVRSNGDLTIASDWNLYSASRAGGEPGVLTLRARGGLNINGSLSDGFSTALPTAALQGGDSWSYRLVAGADTLAANPMATRQDAGHFTLAAGKLIRTGTGDIQIAAGGNFNLGGSSYSQTAAIYSAGSKIDNPSGINLPATTIFGGFSQGGGDISIEAGGDVRGAESNQLYSQWLYRQGKLNGSAEFDASNPQTAWWINFGNFQQGVAALGGGDVRVTAGRHVEDLSVSSASQGYLTGSQPDAASLYELGGGDVSVLAGGNVLGGQFYVAKGDGTLRSGGELLDGRTLAGIPGTDGKLYPLLAVADGQWDIQSRGSARLAGVINPTMVVQSGANASTIGVQAKYKSYFFNYGEDSGVKVASLNGEVRLVNNPGLIATPSKTATGSQKLSFISNASGDDFKALSVYPGSLRAIAYQGDVQLGVLPTDNIALYPSDRGQLELLAHGSVLVSGGSMNMSDLDPARAQPSYAPVAATAAPAGLLVTDDFIGRDYHADVPLHENDPEPARIVARLGDVDIVNNQNARFIVAKPAIVEAGGDIRNLTLLSQHFTEDSASHVSAGGSISYPAAGVNNRYFIQANGPGDLFIEAGKNVDLGSSLGILSRGNLDNPALPDAGAAIHVLAGTARLHERAAALAADMAAARETGVVPPALLAEARLLTGDPSLSAENAAATLAQLKTFAGVVGRLLSQARDRLAQGVPDETLLSMGRLMTGNGDLAMAEMPAALESLQGMPELQRMALGRDFLTKATTQFARNAADPNHPDYKNYDAVYRAMNLVFPGSSCGAEPCQTASYSGDVNLFFSQIKTERGGAVEVYAPGGQILVGLANVPAELLAQKGGYTADPVTGQLTDVPDYNKAAARLGIMTLDGGDIRLFAAEDVLVNQSRVLTVAGGDILAWSSFQDIDAGKGRKTAASAPPPLVTVDADGNVVTEVQGLASGSGIGALITKPGQAPSDIDLYAPRGTIDAGDAGIRTSGNFYAGAQDFRGSDNIQVGGISVGVPVADTGMSAGLAGVSGLSDAASANDAVTKSIGSSAENADKTKETARQMLAGLRPSSISVEVLGFGGGTGSTAEAGEDER